MKTHPRRILFVLLGFIIIAGLFFFFIDKRGNIFSGAGLPLQTGKVVIEMYRDEYTPSEIKIRQGTTVTFVNKSEVARWPASDLHPSHGIYPEFDPRGPVASGEEWNFTFNKTGEWTMHDHLAPYITGNILVVE